MQQQARLLPEFLVQNSLSAHTQVFQKCWSRVPPPSPPLMTYVGAGVWRLIAVSPKDTVSFPTLKERKGLFCYVLFAARICPPTPPVF